MVSPSPTTAVRRLILDRARSPRQVRLPHPPPIGPIIPALVSEHHHSTKIRGFKTLSGEARKVDLRRALLREDRNKNAQYASARCSQQR